MGYGDLSRQEGCAVRGPYGIYNHELRRRASGFSVEYQGEPPASFTVDGAKYSRRRDAEAQPTSPTVWLDFGDGPEVAGTLVQANLLTLPDADPEGGYALLLMRRSGDGA